MKTITSTQDSSAGLTPTRHEVKLTLCEGRIEFARVDNGYPVSREAIHRFIDEWLDNMRPARNMSGQAKVL